ncbi:MAG: glycerophosphodiester phosphodiesterase family protein [Polyangia bacterium]
MTQPSLSVPAPDRAARARRSRGRRALFVLLSLLAAAPVLLLLAAYAQSPTSAGAPIAARLHVPYPAVIAHRGLSAWAPEETRAAYLLARELGADYLEADVQRTSDGVLIALHDDTLERTTDVAAVFPERRGRGADAFTWQELQRLDAGSWWNAAHPERARPAYVGLRILRIEELLDLAGSAAASGRPQRPGLYLETKGAGRYAGYERELVTLLRARGWLDAPPDGAPAATARVLFQSFVPESLVRLRELAPAVPRVLLIDRKDVGKEPWHAFVQRAAALGAGIGPSGYEGMPWHTGPAHRAGLLVHHYTINPEWQLRLLRQLGSDGVFTDSADRALAVFGRLGGRDRAAVLAEAFARTGL